MGESIKLALLVQMDKSYERHIYTLFIYSILTQVGYGADSDWVKGMVQREMGVTMACRLHDLTTAGRPLVYAAVSY